VSARLVRNGTLEAREALAHGTFTTHPGTINPDP
jgi:hypothetical protein